MKKKKKKTKMKKYNKRELIVKIELMSEEAQRYLCDLLCHKFYNMPINFDKNLKIAELYSCGLVYKATQKEDFKEFTILELESILRSFGEYLTYEGTKEEYIEKIFKYPKKIDECYFPILNFNIQRVIFDFLCKKFGIEILN